MIRFLVILLVFKIVGFTGCERMETMDATYPNYEAAIKASTVGAGKWIPEFLPPSSKNIHERHNIDTNEVWLFFSFNYLSDIEDLEKSCKRVAFHNIVFLDILVFGGPRHYLGGLKILKTRIEIMNIIDVKMMVL